jgi:hypothetical protein
VWVSSLLELSSLEASSTSLHPEPVRLVAFQFQLFCEAQAEDGGIDELLPAGLLPSEMLRTGLFLVEQRFLTDQLPVEFPSAELSRTASQGGKPLLSHILRNREVGVGVRQRLWDEIGSCDAFVTISG